MAGDLEMRVTVRPDVMQGQPCVRGTRLTVANLLRQMSEGRSPEGLCHDYPQLTSADLRDVLRFAALLASGKTYDL